MFNHGITSYIAITQDASFVNDQFPAWRIWSISTLPDAKLLLHIQFQLVCCYQNIHAPETRLSMNKELTIFIFNKKIKCNE